MNATAVSTNAPSTSLTRFEAEDYLFREARLLDEWRLEEWAALFTQDGEYLVPPLDQPDGQPGRDLFLIYDDHLRLVERAKRLLKKQAHAEFPHSVVRRIVGNVIVDGESEGLIRVVANFVVYRSRNGESEVFPGHALYDLARSEAQGIQIRRKRVVVDSDSLREQGRISIIL
ncbi:MAG: aromatic-ring-hydroxylating dioxygenase subunit beta [Janthinobacterium lividum]